MANKKRRKKKQKARELIEEENVINLDEKRELRRRQLRAEAEAARKKRGIKSIKDQMMDEIALGDEPEAAIAADGVRTVSGRGKIRKKRKLPFQLKIVMAVVIVVFCALVFSIGNIISLKLQEAEAEDKLAALTAEKDALAEQVGEIGTDEYIEQQARNWLKMAKQGEIVYVLTDEAADKAKKNVAGESSADIVAAAGKGDDADTNI